MLKKEIFFGISLEEIGVIFGAVFALIGFGISLVEFIKNNRTKRAEFLDKLTQEFNEPKMFIAKKILDDFWIGSEGSPEISNEDLINQGSSVKIENLDAAIAHLLRDHKKDCVTNPAEQRARQSFDDLLDFFTKLQYYLDLDLITEKELNYFRYYVIKAKKKAGGAVLKYAGYYDFPDAIRMIKTVNSKKKNKWKTLWS